MNNGILTWDNYFKESFNFNSKRTENNIFSGEYNFDRKVCTQLLDIMCQEFSVSEKSFTMLDNIMTFINAIYYNTDAIGGLNSMGDLSKPMQSIIEKYSLTGSRPSYCAEAIYAKLGLNQFKDTILKYGQEI